MYNSITNNSKDLATVIQASCTAAMHCSEITTGLQCSSQIERYTPEKPCHNNPKLVELVLYTFKALKILGFGCQKESFLPYGFPPMLCV